jgi:hypothetical protein
MAVQLDGGAAGCLLANMMFAQPIAWSTTARSEPNLWAGELVATLGLLLVIFGVVRSGQATAAPFTVSAYITAPIGLRPRPASPTLRSRGGRTLPDTFAGIAPASAPIFVVSQLVVGWYGCCTPDVAQVADTVVLPSQQTMKAEP